MEPTGVGDWQVAAPLDDLSSPNPPAVVDETPLEVFRPSVDFSVQDEPSQPMQEASSAVTPVGDLQAEQSPAAMPGHVRDSDLISGSVSSSTRHQPRMSLEMRMATPPGLVQGSDDDGAVHWKDDAGGTVDMLMLEQNDEPSPLPMWSEVPGAELSSSSIASFSMEPAEKLLDDADADLWIANSETRRRTDLSGSAGGGHEVPSTSGRFFERLKSRSSNSDIIAEDSMLKSSMKSRISKSSGAESSESKSRSKIGFLQFDEVAEYDDEAPAHSEFITKMRISDAESFKGSELLPVGGNEEQDEQQRSSEEDQYAGEVQFVQGTPESIQHDPVKSYRRPPVKKSSREILTDSLRSSLTRLTSRWSISGMSMISETAEVQPVPSWFKSTPGVAQVLALNRATPEFRDAWVDLKTSYSKRHQEEDARSDFQQETENLAKRLNQTLVPAIAPNKSPYLRYWDAFLMVLISFTTMLQPYETTFGIPAAFSVVNYVMDSVFLLDLVLQFNIAYVDQASVKLITRHDLIAKHYLKSAFAIDFIASLPYELIMHYIPLDNNPDGMRRLLILIPLLRLFRLGRAKRIILRMEQLYSIDHGMLSIITFIVQTAMMCHFCACLWGLVPLFQGHGPFGEFHDHETPYSSYAACLYFGVMTLTSVGYGDIWPVTTYERWLAMLIMLLGAYFFGYVIGSITNTVSIRNHAQNFFYETMDKLQAFVEEHQVGKDLSMRLRSYFIYRYQSDAGAGVSWNELFDLMSPSLKQQVAKATCAKWISDVPYFNGCEEDFIILLSLSLHPETYTPQEKLIALGEESNRMYVVRQGIVASEGRICISGGVIGIDMLTNLYIMSELIRNYEAIALTFSNVMRCEKEDVLDILDKFPNTSATLRRTVIRNVFQMEVRSYSRAVIRIITGRRSVHARLMGDPSGREEHYYQKLLELSPTRDPLTIRKSLDVSLSELKRSIEGSVNSLEIRAKSAKKPAAAAGRALHRAHQDKGVQLKFAGSEYAVDQVPEVIMNAVKSLSLQVRELKLELDNQRQLNGNSSARRIAAGDIVAPLYLKQRSGATLRDGGGVRITLTPGPRARTEDRPVLSHSPSMVPQSSSDAGPSSRSSKSTTFHRQRANPAQSPGNGMFAGSSEGAEITSFRDS